MVARAGDSANRVQQDSLSWTSMVAAAVVLDLLLVSLVVWTLARANGIELWPMQAPVSAFCFSLPIVIVVGAWSAQRFSFRHAFSFRSHLMRSAAGGLAAAVFALALYLGISGDAVSIPVFIVASGLVLVCALHANYLGVVRSLTRSGILVRPAAMDD